MILSPVDKDEHLFIDGCVVDNLPAGQVKEMGADYIIGVDLSTSTQLKDKPNNVMEIAISVMNLMQARAALQDIPLIDCYINPKVNDLFAWSFGDSDELEKRGQAAAELVIDQLRKDLGRAT
jgi:NTE family protein